MSDCRIILVDDHTLFRGGLRGLLDRYEGFRVVGEAGSGEELLERIGEWQADVVFMDIAMPGMGGAVATQRLLALRPQWRVITLSMFGDEHYYQRMVEAGARGFLLKDSPFDEVVRAVETVHGGGCVGVVKRRFGALDAAALFEVIDIFGPDRDLGGAVIARGAAEHPAQRGCGDQHAEDE